MNARKHRVLPAADTPDMTATGFAITAVIAVTLTFSKGKAGGRVPAAGTPALYNRSMRMFSRTLTPSKKKRKRGELKWKETTVCRSH